ncbi:MAG: hypothetical protein LJE92_02410 [Gammaproteobacteria bacterium]|jgi:hypothetical protein|nr:hypothetical protein [Gammaproteobacteria bacterium]
MPYYLFKISELDNHDLIKHLELLQVCDAFKSAQREARELRAEKPLDGITYKVMFAENQLAAEEILLKKRDKPVLMEYER